MISTIILGVYFGVNFVGHVLRSSAYDQSDLQYIDDIVHNKEKGIEVTVRGPTVYGGGHGYFAIWDRSSGMAGVDIYYPGDVMTDAPPGGIVEVTGTTISGRNGFGILGESITVIESKPFFSLPTFGDTGTNLTYSGIIILISGLAIGLTISYINRKD